MSSSNWSLSCCSWARCSGVIELSIACIAAIRLAICSNSSSSVCGFSGKKSPYCSMNCSKRGSSPRSRRSIISLSAAIMSFIRAMSSGVMFCMDEDIWSTICCMSCWRSFSISCSKRCCASRLSKSYALSSRTLPARSSGSMSRRKLRSMAASRAAWARRSSPLRSASRVAFSMAWRSSSTMSFNSSAISPYTPPRSKRSSRCSRSSRSFCSSSRRPCIWLPLRSRMPCCMRRRRAALTSPWYRRSSVRSSNRASASRSNPFWVPSQRE